MKLANALDGMEHFAILGSTYGDALLSTEKFILFLQYREKRTELPLNEVAPFSLRMDVFILPNLQPHAARQCAL